MRPNWKEKSVYKLFVIHLLIDLQYQSLFVHIVQLAGQTYFLQINITLEMYKNLN